MERQSLDPPQILSGDSDIEIQVPPDTTTDWSEYPTFIGSPPSSPFHGFGPQDKIEGKLVIETELVDGEEVFKSICREKRRGRPKGNQIDESLIVVENRMKKAPITPTADPPPWRTSEPLTSIQKSSLGGTGSRPLLFLLGQTPESFRYAKIPTTGAVLGRFLNNLDNSIPKEAAGETRQELKDVWLHHFGPRLIEGREFGIEEMEDKSKKMIKTDRHIEDKIKDVWKDWVKLEHESRRPERSSYANLMIGRRKLSI